MIVEYNGDLFTNYNDNCFSYAHCVSADLVMGAGIAIKFKEKYSERFNELDESKLGNIVYWQNGNQFVYNLITKNLYWQKPTYKTLKSALYNMYNHAMLNGIKIIIMPRIGCGLDRLEWNKVKEIINEIFTEITVHIYNL